MKFVIGAFPGFALACGIIILLIGGFELFVYSKTRYKRSRNIVLFCLFTAIYTFQQFVVQSRRFDPLMTLYFGYVAQVCVVLGFLYYFKAMRYYVVVGEKFAKVIYALLILLAVSRFIVFPYLILTGEDLFFNIGDLKDSGSYFFNSYTMRVGTPKNLPKIIMNIFSLVTTVTSLYMMRVVLKGSKDRFLLVGLFFTLFTNVYQYFLLPFTLQYHVSIVFLSNFFEAFRMIFLSVKEYILESEAVKEDPSKKLLDVPQEKYQNTNLSEQRIQSLVLQVNELMKNVTFFTNPNLRLEDMARQLKVPSYQLSQVLHIGLGMGFYDLINGARVNEICKLMKDPANSEETIINLAYKVGFNAKSTFNTAFKKFTGMTPSEYRRQIS